MPKQEIIKKSEMVAIHNAITDQMETAKVTMIVQRDVAKYKEPFTILFQASTLAMGRHISPSASKLLINLCGCVGYGNIIEKGIDELAEHMLYSRRQIERALKELIYYNVLIASKHPADKRITQYHLNAHQSWKGNVKDRKTKIASYNKNQLTLFAGEKINALKPNKEF
jgi:hypothetical protein